MRMGVGNGSTNLFIHMGVKVVYQKAVGGCWSWEKPFKQQGLVSLAAAKGSFWKEDPNSSGDPDIVGGLDRWFGFEVVVLVEGKWEQTPFHHQTTDSAPNHLRPDPPPYKHQCLLAGEASEIRVL